MKNRKEIQLALCKSEEEKEWKYIQNISAAHTQIFLKFMALL